MRYLTPLAVGVLCVGASRLAVSQTLLEGPLELGSAAGEPGETLRIPIHATLERPVHLFQLIVRYDPDRLSYLGYDVQGSALDGADPLGVGFNVFPGGHATCGLYDTGTPLPLAFKVAPGVRVLLGHLRFLVRSAAAPGVVPLQLRQGIEGTGAGLAYSVLTDGGYASSYPSALIDGSAEVLPPSGPRPVGDLQCTQFLDEAHLSFTLPEAYDRIEIRRDGASVASLPGAAGSFSEALPGLGVYTYTVSAERAGVDSLPATCALTALAPTAPAVTQLTCDDTGLQWQSPVVYEHVAVFRNGTLIAELPGSATSFVDAERPEGLTIYSVAGELRGFRSPLVNCLDRGIWILEVGDVEVPLDAERLEIPIYATTSDTIIGIGFCLEIDAQAFTFIQDFEAAMEGTDGHQEPEFLAMGARGACGFPAAGLVYDYNPPRNPEKNLQVGLRQHVLTYSFKPARQPAPGETFAVSLVVGGNGGTTFTLAGSVSQHPDIVIPGRVRFGSSGVAAVQGLAAEVAGGGDGGGGAVTSDVVLTWTNPSRYESIHIERNGQPLADVPGSASSFIDSQVPGGVFTYKVLAVDRGQTSFPASALLSTLAPPGAFLRGDTDRDGAIGIGDPIATLTFLFVSGKALPCQDAADANDDGQLGVTDAIVSLSYLFLGTAVLKAPGTRYPWFDPTPDALDCGK